MSEVQKRLRALREAERAARHAKWFEKHVAAVRTYTAADGVELEELRWGRTDSGIYAITYRAIGSTLLVTGDMYPAVYIVGSPVALEWWSRCDLHYFAGKCVASPVGRSYREWDDYEATRSMRRLLAERDTKCRRAFADEDGWNALISKDSWFAWLNENGYEVLGDDFYEYAANVGERISMECEAHLFGLKAAISQLAAHEVAA